MASCSSCGREHEGSFVYNEDHQKSLETTREI